jgi:hypothetical protein
MRKLAILGALVAALAGAIPSWAQTGTMGVTTVLPAADSQNGNLLLAQQATLSEAATLQSLSFYVSSAAGSLRLGVYDSTGPGGGPGALLAQTAGAAAVKGWNTQPTGSGPTLPAGTYWLAYLPSSSTLAFHKENNTGPCYYYFYKYAAMPATFSPTPSSCTPTNWSFYATLVGGPLSPTPTPKPKPIGVSFTPSSPSLPDTSIAGAVISSIGVTMSDGSQFTGTLSLTANPSGTAVISGAKLELARNLSPADVGTIEPFTVQASGNGGTASGNVNLTVTAAPPPTLTLTVSPYGLSVPSTDPLGAVVATVTAAWSNGSQFTGTINFVAPYNDDGGTFALSCTQCATANLIISPLGMGVSGDGGTVQNVTLEASQ